MLADLLVVSVHVNEKIFKTDNLQMSTSLQWPGRLEHFFYYTLKSQSLNIFSYFVICLTGSHIYKAFFSSVEGYSSTDNTYR